MDGGSFENFLKDEGVFDEIDVLATKKILALKIEEMMEKQNISKSEMARKMRTKRGLVYDLLNPDKDYKLTTLAKAAGVLGKRLKVELVGRR